MVKTVLIVDDDRALLDQQLAAFRPFRAHLTVLAVDNGADALEILENRAVDLLVLDLEMPVMDGFELLNYALELQPDLSLFLLSEVDTRSFDRSLIAAGNTEVLRKPLEQGLLVERTRRLFAQRTRGFLSGVSLSGLLQLLHMEQANCSLTIRSSRRHGSIELHDGEIVAAFAAGRKGAEALFEILSWRGQDVELVGSYVETPREIEQPFEGLLLEAARLSDEATRDRSALTLNWIESEGPGAPEAIELSPLVRERVQQLLHRMLLVEGVLGAGLIDLRSGACLVSESRRLQVDFEEGAAQLATVARTRRHYLLARDADSRVHKFMVALNDEVEMLHALRSAPLGLYALARQDVQQPELEATLDRLIAKVDTVLRERKPSAAPADASVLDQDDPVPPVSAGQG